MNLSEGAIRVVGAVISALWTESSDYAGTSDGLPVPIHRGDNDEVRSYPGAGCCVPGLRWMIRVTIMCIWMGMSSKDSSPSQQAHMHINTGALNTA